MFGCLDFNRDILAELLTTVFSDGQNTIYFSLELCSTCTEVLKHDEDFVDPCSSFGDILIVI